MADDDRGVDTNLTPIDLSRLLATFGLPPVGHELSVGTLGGDVVTGVVKGAVVSRQFVESLLVTMDNGTEATIPWHAASIVLTPPPAGPWWPPRDGDVLVVDGRAAGSTANVTGIWDGDLLAFTSGVLWDIASLRWEVEHGSRVRLLVRDGDPVDTATATHALTSEEMGT